MTAGVSGGRERRAKLRAVLDLASYSEQRDFAPPHDFPVCRTAFLGAMLRGTYGAPNTTVTGGSRRCCGRAGWQVGKDPVQRIWRCEGLKVPAQHLLRERLWLENGSCVRLRPKREAMTHDGRTLRILALIDAEVAWRAWGRQRCTSNAGVRGRTDIAGASTASCVPSA